MGYSYDHFTGRLCCDKCGKNGGVRKRKCPHKVTTEFGNDPLPYCPAPALCKECWEKVGKNKIHDRCKEPAERAQLKYDERRRKLEAGDLIVRSAYGSGISYANVPKGFVGVLFEGLNNQRVQRLVREEDYRGGGFLSDYPDAQPWNGVAYNKRIA